MATGMSDGTVKNGIAELRDENALRSDRQRRPGGARKPPEHNNKNSRETVERLVEPTERGDPQSPLR